MSETTDAPIQTDVVEEVEVDAVGTDLKVKTDRETIMDSIVDARTKELENDIGEPIAAEDVSLEDLSEVVVEDVELVEVKIDGVVEKVTPEEIRDYQVNKAADVRLREASAETQRLAEKELELDQREAALDKKPPVDTTELAEKLVKSTFDEDAEGTAEVIQTIMDQRPVAEAVVAPTISAEDVDAALYRKEQRSAITRFESDYPFMAKNKGMRDLVNERTKAERVDDPDGKVWDIIERAVKHVEKEVKTELGTPAEVEAEQELVKDLGKRRKQKEKTGPTVVSSAAAKAALPNADKTKPQSRQQSFFEIQKGRGQG